MSDTTPKKVSAWSWALLLAPVLLLVGYTYFTRGGRAGSGVGDGEFVFDPQPFKELELKGVAADGASSWSAMAATDSPAMDETLLAHGKELYSKACAACHGEDGKGEGPLLPRLNLNTRPANFTTPIASIKVRSTEKNTLPQDADLFRTLTRGLPGTAMLSFRNLPETDRWALVRRVKEFFTGGKKWAAPKPLEIPKALPRDDALLAEGRQQWKWCQNCHGDEGLGGTSPAFQMQRMYPAINFARAGGKYMLRGSTPEDIVRTLLAGSSGASPMMSFKPTFYRDDADPHEMGAGDRKLWGTVYYARKLIEEQAR